MVVGLFFFFLGLIIYFFRLTYFAKTRYVFKNETEKREFLKERYIHLIGKKEKIETRHYGRFSNYNKLKKTAFIETEVDDILVSHPGKSNLKPWLVLKQSIFYPRSLEVFRFDSVDHLGNNLEGITKGHLIPKKHYVYEVILSILDKDLENIEDYVKKFPEGYISPHQKNLIGSYNQNDKFDDNNNPLE